MVNIKSKKYLTKEQRIKELERTIKSMKEQGFQSDIVGIYTNELKSLKEDLNNDKNNS